MSFRILVIDRTPDAHVRYQKAFKNKNYAFQIVPSLGEGVKKISKKVHFTFQFIVIDATALECEEDPAFSKKFPNMPILFLLDAQQTSFLESLESNVFILFKPFDSKKLRQKVKKLEKWVSIQEKHKRHKLAVKTISHFTQETGLKLILDNNSDNIPLAVNYILYFLEIGGAGENDLFRIKLGLTELLINAVAHGNLEMSSMELKGTEKNFDRWDSELKKREKSPKYRDRRVYVSLSYSIGKEIVLMIEDEGSGFDSSKSLGKSRDDEDMYNAYGRGLKMVQATSDRMEYNNKGNRVVLHYFPQDE
ncbi:MAG: ATP-binding protein [SAR324 cluster bacterium]|nr:ATP-binding protein [SAR324 cluster bacterium]